MIKARGGGSQVKILIISVFNPSKNLEYKDSGTFYGIEKYRFSGENGRSEVGTCHEMSQNV